MRADVATLGASVALYLAGAALLGAYVLSRRNPLLWAGRVAAIGAILLHTVAIGLRCTLLHRAPFATPAESLSLLSYTVALAYLAADFGKRLAATGPFALGLSFLLLLIAATGGGAGDRVVPPILSQRIISVHIVAIISAFGLFALANCCAALYLLEHHILKSRHGLSWMRHLPPLLAVESSAFLLVTVGFPLLTLGILAGLIGAVGGNLPSGWAYDPKLLLAYGVWGVYGGYLIARLKARWTPVRSAVVLIVGMVLCLLLLMVPTGVHRFG